MLSIVHNPIIRQHAIDEPFRDGLDARQHDRRLDVLASVRLLLELGQDELLADTTCLRVLCEELLVSRGDRRCLQVAQRAVCNVPQSMLALACSVDCIRG